MEALTQEAWTVKKKICKKPLISTASELIMQALIWYCTIFPFLEHCTMRSMKKEILNYFHIYTEKLDILTVNLIAFSGATPINCGTRPRYRPVTPSCLITFLKQSKLFLYINSPIYEPVLWFCIRVLTKSIG